MLPSGSWAGNGVVIAVNPHTHQLLGCGVQENLGIDARGSVAKPFPQWHSFQVRCAAIGSQHMAAVDVHGTVFTTGSNQFGQLGLGDAAGRAVASSGKPHAVDLRAAGMAADDRVVAVDVGVAGTTACLTAKGEVWASGEGVGCGLGGNTATFRRVDPAHFGGHAVTSVSIGGTVGIYVTDDGSVYTAGYERNSETKHTQGRGPDVPLATLVPTRIDSLRDAGVNAVAAAAGRMHGAVLDDHGAVYVWGANSGGQLGLGDTQDRHTPERVPGLPPVVDVACGWYTTIAACVDGRVFAWGAGAIGTPDGTAAVADGNGQAHWKSLVPRIVGGLPAGYRARKVSAGQLHSVVALTAADTPSDDGARIADCVVCMFGWNDASPRVMNPTPVTIASFDAPAARQAGDGDANAASGAAGAGSGSGAGAAIIHNAAAIPRYSLLPQPTVWTAVSYIAEPVSSDALANTFAGLEAAVASSPDVQHAKPEDTVCVVVSDHHGYADTHPLAGALPALAARFQLVSLVLTSCTLDCGRGGGVDSILAGLAAVPSLTSLSLESCAFATAGATEPDTAALARCVAGAASVPHLRELVADGADDGVAGAVAGVMTVDTFHLARLALPHGTFSTAGYAALSAGLATNSSLLALDLPHNPAVSPDAAAALASPGLAMNTTLMRLDMRVDHPECAGVEAAGLKSIVAAVQANASSRLADLIVYSTSPRGPAVDATLQQSVSEMLMRQPPGAVPNAVALVALDLPRDDVFA